MKGFRFINDILNVSSRTADIKRDPETRAKSVRLGVQAILFSVYAAVAAIAGVLLFYFGMNNFGELYVILAIFPLAFGLGLIVSAFAMFIGALLRVIVQLTINRRAVGFIALAVLIAAVAGVAIFIFTTI